MRQKISLIQNEHEELVMERKGALNDISRLENISKENESRKQTIMKLQRY